MSLNKKLTISVVIPTYTRLETLKLTLDSLVAQSCSSERFEIIVVDNNSTDDTAKYVRDFASKHSKYQIRYCLEKTQGLSAAKNRGTREAKADYVAFIDDDAKATKGWLEKAVEIIKDKAPKIFGGPIYPFYLTEKPDWFKDEYEIRMHAEQTGWMPERSYISGSNAFFSKEILKQLGGFPEELGMKGDQLSYGEETYLCYIAQQNGVKLYYDIDLMVKHLVPAQKMRLSYFLYSRYNSGKSTYILDKNLGQVKTEYISELNLLSGFNDKVEAIGKKWKESSSDCDNLEKDLEVFIEEFLPAMWRLGYQYQHTTTKSSKKSIISTLKNYFNQLTS